MDINRERIRDDLRGLLKGDVLADDVHLQLYASDASIYQIRPLMVVRPRGTGDVVATVRYAAENRLPLHARGAGSGLAGESLGPGIVIDFSRYMRRIIEFNGSTVTIQPGVVHAQLNQFLRPHGLQFGPDPAMTQVTTMGGVVSVDSGGSHWLKYGSARRHVEGMQIVLADGTRLTCGREALADDLTGEPTRRDQLISQLLECLTRNAQTIRDHQPQSVVNRCGYQLADVLQGETVDLARLIAGSTGTLALITQITVAVQPLPKQRGVTLVLFDRLENAARAVMEVLPTNPSACDLMDRRHLSLAREAAVHYDLLIPPEIEGALLIEYEGDSLAAVRDQLNQIVDRLRRRKRLATLGLIAQDRDETELYWKLAQGVTPTLHRFKGTTRPLPFVEDFAVPPQELAPFLVQMQNVLKQHQVTASLFGHAGQGQLHLRPFLDPSNPEDVARMTPLATDLYREVLEVGGTISGEHGDGLSRTQFIRTQYGPLADVFREVKQIFDPAGVLNPGKVVGDVPDLLTQNLRPVTPAVGEALGPNLAVENASENAAAGDASREHIAPSVTIGSPKPLIELQLNWTGEQLAANTRDCNGCGACRSQTLNVRMCPIFRYAPAEEASPRAKANLMRAILSNQLDPGTLSTDEFKGVADLCVHCHMCRQECPAGVDIPSLMMEGKGAYVQTNGLNLKDWAMANIDALSWLGQMVSTAGNWAIGNRPVRWFLEKLLGIAQARKLPRFAPKSFLRIAARRKLTRTTRRAGGKVLYFVDTFANYHDPQLAQALVAVLEHNGIAVYVHPDQLASGMSMIALGAIAKAKQVAAHNVRILADAVRQGYSIITTEPSAAMCLKHEYRKLVADDDARLVAEHSVESCDFLWQLHRGGRLRLDLKPVNARLGYHQPCHLRALDIGTPSENLLGLIPGLVITEIDAGCSGMAGTFGLQRKNFRASLRAGRGLTRALRNQNIHLGVTECSACKLQMEQGAAKTTMHPIKLLALSYGLMPEVANLLKVRGEELYVS
jgi:FAD/FMN-containing dehydrogenase/Fe-S oxidoreductase